MAEEKKSLKAGLAAARRGVESKKDAHPLCYDEPVVDIQINGGKKARAKITAVINEMCKSPSGRMILEEAAANGYELEFDPDAVAAGQYGNADPSAMVCALSPANTLEENVATLAHELRHAYQYEYDMADKVDRHDYDTKSCMHLTRTMEADAESFGCLVAWELKEAGYPACWDDFNESYPEITKPFADEMAKTGDVDKARTAAFVGWYDNTERRDSYDETLVQGLESVSPQYLKKKLKSFPVKKMIASFCTDPGRAEPYFSQDPAILETGKYVAIYFDQKERLEEYAAQRAAAVPSSIPDKSVSSLIAQERPVPERKAKAVGAEAKEIALATRQQRVGAEIRTMKSESVKSPSPVVVAALKRSNGR